MTELDTQDMSLYLVYDHVRSRGMKQLSQQLYKLGVSAGIDLTEVSVGFNIKEVADEGFQNADPNIKCAFDEVLAGLVCKYLKKTGQSDVAEILARKCNLQKTNSEMPNDLETIFQAESQSKPTKKVRAKPVFQQYLAGVHFKDTDEVRFSNTNSKGGAIIMTYKDKKYTLGGKRKDGKVSYWQCRFQRKLKCPGRVIYNSDLCSITKEVPHNEKDHSDRLIASTMGTSDNTITYSKSLKKRTLLHYQGYKYFQEKTLIGGKINWRCINQKQKKCKGHLHTKNGTIHGHVREHSHLPEDLPPVDRPKENRMISNLFL